MNGDWGKIARWTVLGALWLAVGAYAVAAARMVHRHRSELRITHVDIDIVDSTGHGRLVSSAMVRSWIARSGVKTVGEPAAEVDLRALEHAIGSNGFVDRVKASVTYAGRIEIRVSQRTPSVRLLFDGYDCYATDDGYVFPAPRQSSLYLPVVTGSYRPPFPSDFSGDTGALLEEKIAESNARIAEIDREKYPYYLREREVADSMKAVRRMFTSKRMFESRAAFDERVRRLREHKAALRRRYRYRMRVVEEKIDAVTARQQAELAAQKKLRKSYEDFHKLITFVNWIESDDFWRSETVQIVASSTPAGELEVELVPRSGRFVVLFGRIGTKEENREKLDRLSEFYRKGLGSIGWDEYRTINVKYKGQVVCAK
ncbi:MAG: hypothetical protein K2J51_04510 [Alistipes sp.]|nr:hypothetical protein [Alistipes sp.]MDE6778714.1 hypothetical protein [Alistipes sp.]